MNKERVYLQALLKKAVLGFFGEIQRGIVFKFSFYSFLFLFSVPVISQNITEDTLKIKEVHIRAKKPIEEVGIVKSKIDSSILKASESESLSELLSENTPIFVKSDGRGASSRVSFRGTSAAHTDVFWNGISIQSPIDGEVDFSLIPMFLIDDISLLHGGASIQNGSGAIGGSINIDNVPDWNNKLSICFKQDFGSYTTINDYLQVEIGNKKIQSRTRLFYNYSKNDYTFLNKRIEDIDPVTGERTYRTQKNTNADYQLYGVLQELFFRMKNNFTLSAKYWGQLNSRNLPWVNTYEGDIRSNLNKQTSETHRVLTDLKHFGKKTKFEFTSALLLSENVFMTEKYSKGRGYQTNAYAIGKSKSSDNHINYSYKLFPKTKLKAQYKFNYHHIHSDDTVRNYMYDKEQIEQHFFLSIHQEISSRFSSVLMLRKYFSNTNQSPFTPYLGLEYIVSEKYQFIAKSSVSKSFHAPSLKDLYYLPSGNPNLKPEEGWSADISLSASSKIMNILTEASLTGFYSDINDWIIWIPSPMEYRSALNIKKVISKGIEASLKTNFKFKQLSFKINMNYAYTRAINKNKSDIWGEGSYDKQLVFVPIHSLNLFSQVSWRKFYFNYQHNSFSERFTTSTNDIESRDWLYPYFMNNIGLGKEMKFKKIQLDIKLKVYNLFDETYRSVLSRMMPGRNYLLSLSIKF